MKRTINLPRMERSIKAEVRRVVRDEGGQTPEAPQPDDLYEMVASTEDAVEAYWYGVGWVREILTHTKAAIDTRYLDVGAAYMVRHNEDQMVGVIEEYDIDEAKGRLVVRFRFSSSPLAQQIKDDLVRGIRRQASIGYQVNAATLTKRGDPDKGELDEYECDWTFYEASTVPVAADVKAGTKKGKKAREEHLAAMYQRAAEAGDVFPVTIDDGEPVREGTRTMGDENKETEEAQRAKGGAPAAAAATATATITVESATKTERERISKIHEIARVHNIPAERVAKFVEEGTNLDNVRAAVLDLIATTASPQGARERSIDIPRKEMKLYSYARALFGMLKEKEGRGKLDGVEKEVHEEYHSHRPEGMPDHGGTFIPLASGETWRRRGQRALDSKTAGKGAELIFDQYGGDIPLLRPQARCVELGATVLTGLGAPVAWVKQTGGMTFYWMGENPGAAVTGSDISLGLATLSPKTIMGKAVWPRQLVVMANQSVEAMIRAEIEIGHGLAIDRIALYGKGADSQPTGIYKTTGVGAVAFGSAPPTFGKLVDMQTAVADANANLVNLGFLTSAGMSGKLRQTQKVSGQAEMLWTGDLEEGVIAGSRAFATNQVSKTMSGSEDTGGTEHGIVFANWGDLYFGSFSALEITIDIYTLLDQAMVRAVSYGMQDVMLRHPESFCKSTAATIV